MSTEPKIYWRDIGATGAIPLDKDGCYHWHSPNGKIYLGYWQGVAEHPQSNHMLYNEAGSAEQYLKREAQMGRYRGIHR
jgi:hypothetical protein